MFCSRLALSLPQVVTFSNGSTITYYYAADGTKVRTVHVINGATTQTDYCGNVIYENGVQKLLQTEEGYVAGSNGMPWWASRIAFDLYQGSIEGVSTQNAEYYGWRMGYNLSPNRKLSNFKKSMKSLFNKLW